VNIIPVRLMIGRWTVTYKIMFTSSFPFCSLHPMSDVTQNTLRYYEWQYIWQVATWKRITFQLQKKKGRDNSVYRIDRCLLWE